MSIIAVAMLTASLLQMTVGALAPLLREELSLSAAEIGFLGTTTFAAAAAWSPLAGRLTDRFGGRSQVIALYVLAAATLGLMAAARSAVALYAAMVLGGFALASQNPATNHLIARHAAPAVQPRLLATKQTGAQLAGVVAGLLPASALVAGWRLPLVILAGSSALLAVLSRSQLPNRPQESRTAPTPTEHQPSNSQRPLVVYATVMGWGVGAVITYLPLYAFDALSMPASLAGSLLAYLAVVGAITLSPWVRLADRLSAPSLALTAMAALAAVGIATVSVASEVARWLLWPGLALLGATYTTWLAVAMLAIVRARPQVGSGRLSGRVLRGFFIGMAVGPATFGQVVERASYGGALTLIFVAFLIGAGVSLLSYRRAATTDDEACPST